MNQTCIRCKQSKPLEDYYKHPGMASGRLGRCKVCHREEITRNRNENIERIRDYDCKRNKTENRKQDQTLKNKDKRKRMGSNYNAAHCAVSRAVKAGLLVRPDHCTRCLINCFPQAHHDDYSKMLEVMWLCAICHAVRHRELGRLRTVSNMRTQGIDV